jgi:hypothetical protein
LIRISEDWHAAEEGIRGQPHLILGREADLGQQHPPAGRFDLLHPLLSLSLAPAALGRRPTPGGRGSAGEPDGEGEGGRAVEACAARWRGEERREAGFGCDGVLVEAKPRLGSCVMERRRRCRSGERIEREGRGRWGKLESMTNGPCSG